jgi:His/Glu/Gln/Arg/opine family amino acid ABC transporter permease subunit
MFTLWGQYFSQFVGGLLITIEVTAAALAVALIIGQVCAAMRLSHFRVLRLLGTLYVELFRGAPILLVLYVAYFGLGQIGIRLPAYWAAVAALGTFYGALFTEIFRGGLQGVDPGQSEAATALGMSPWLRLTRVVLPQAVIAILLPSTNSTADIIKDSSLVVTIGLADLMARTYQASSATFEPMDMFLLAGCMYFVLYFLLSRVLGRLELNVQRRYG